MFNFGKKRREAEQQRKIEQLLRTQEEFLALYEQPARPATLQDELASVKASFERGLRGDRG
ncbi:hypothetical protein D3C85_1662440 [compost metagenome]